jgi:hypothetical protein
MGKRLRLMEAVEKMRSDPDPAFREGVLFEIAK